MYYRTLTGKRNKVLSFFGLVLSEPENSGDQICLQFKQFVGFTNYLPST